MTNVQWEDKHSEGRRLYNHPVVYDCMDRKLTPVKKMIEPGLSSLEIGAGDGFFSIHLEKMFELSLSDKSTKMLSTNPFRERALVIDISKDALKNSSYDVVFEANVLHHLDDVDLALEKIFNASKKYVVLIEPNRNNPLTFLLGILLKHERKSLLFNKNYLLKKTSKYPFELVFHHTQGLIPPNKSPVWFWKVFKFLDRPLPWVGLDHLYIFKRKSI